MRGIAFRDVIYGRSSDRRVEQIGNVLTNADYEILLSGTSDDNYYIGETRKTASLTYNPSTNQLNLVGDLKWEPLADDEHGIYWKEQEYGDKFKIYPHFAGTNESNYLTVAAATGAADTDPNLVERFRFYPSGAFSTYNGSLSNRMPSVTVDTSSNNNVTATVSTGMYINDLNNYAYARFRGMAYTSGAIQANIAAFNIKTDGTEVENRLGATVDKDGTLSYVVSSPSAFRSAINAVNKAGDTMTGSLDVQMGTTAGPHVSVNNGTYNVGLHIGSGGVNHGVYDFSLDKWLIYNNGTDTIVNGRASENVLKSGDTMTGDLTISHGGEPSSRLKNPGWTLTTASNNGLSANASAGCRYFLGSDNTTIGYVNCYGQPDGRTRLVLKAYNKKTDGTTVENGIWIDCLKDGTASFSLTSPSAFRSALSLNTFSRWSYAGASNQIYIKVNNASATTKIASGYVYVYKYGCIVMVKLSGVPIPSIDSRSDLTSSTSTTTYHLNSDSLRPVSEIVSASGFFFVEESGAIRMETTSSGKTIWDQVIFITKSF